MEAITETQTNNQYNSFDPNSYIMIPLPPILRREDHDHPINEQPLFQGYYAGHVIATKSWATWPKRKVTTNWYSKYKTIKNVLLELEFSDTAEIIMNYLMKPHHTVDPIEFGIKHFFIVRQKYDNELIDKRITTTSDFFEELHEVEQSLNIQFECEYEPGSLTIHMLEAP